MNYYHSNNGLLCLRNCEVLKSSLRSTSSLKTDDKSEYIIRSSLNCTRSVRGLSTKPPTLSPVSVFSIMTSKMIEAANENSDRLPAHSSSLSAAMSLQFWSIGPIRPKI